MLKKFFKVELIYLFFFIIQHGIAADVNPWFSEREYATMNPELTKITDLKALRAHYLSRGVKEGRFGRLVADPLQFRKSLEVENISPAALFKRDNLDVQRDFKVNDVAVTAIVRGPAGLASKPKEIFRLKLDSETAEQYFLAICDKINKSNLGTLTIPKQTILVEKSNDKFYQLVLKDIKDVGIDFSGTTLIFSDTTKRGLLITGDLQRVRLHNLTIDWNQGFASPASVFLDKDNTIKLKLDELATGNLPITQFFGFYDQKTKVWNAQQGKNLWVSFSDPIHQTAKGDFYSAKELETFRPLLKGRSSVSGLARHFVPGKTSIVITGDKVEDLQLTQFNVLNSAYMGIVVDRIKRGFMLANSSITPKPGAFISTASDALHITSVKDVIIESNTFAGMGDDGTNVQGYTYKLAAGQTTNSFSINSKFFHANPGDSIMVYSPTLDFLGTTTLSEVKILSDQNVSVSFGDISKVILKPKEGFRIGIINQHPIRIVIQNNKYGPNRSRGIVLQGSLALIANNVITAPTNTAIYLSSDADTWSEGMGATSVHIHNNIIKYANFFDITRASRVLGAISLVSEVASPRGIAEFAGMPSRTIGTYPLFQNILITENSISDSKAAGIFVSSARNVKINKNKIKATLLTPEKGQLGFGQDHGVTSLRAITVFRSNGVTSDDANMLVIFPGSESTLSPTNE